MTTGESSISVYDHGTPLDGKKTRVQCNYCDKVVSGISRLKCHLGGIRKDVVPCEKVPKNIKVSFRNLVLESRNESLGKEVEKLSHPDIPWKQNCSPISNGVKHLKCGGGQPAGYGSEEHEEMDSVVGDGVADNHRVRKRRIGSKIAMTGESEADTLSSKTKKCIGRFLYETGVDFSAANSTSFKRMISCISGNVQVKIPTLQELKGWILQDELKEIQEYANKIRQSWTRTGCSILLDGWTDEKGRNLVNFVIECPEGPIYLRSADVSAIVDNADALEILLDEVIEEVGVGNVVQIIACSTKGWMGNVGKQFMIRRKTMFWSVSASHCIELMLEKIKAIDSIQRILDTAKIITKFIYGRPKVLKLMNLYTEGNDLIKPSSMKFAVPFLTLEIMVSLKNNLENMFASSEWKNSYWASTEEGKRVVHLVGDLSFWTAAEVALKATVPLLRVLGLMHRADKPQVGYIYETMDQAKETIKEEFKNKKSLYTPFWKAIDEIWNNCLYSPLHGAGYYFNPSLFYSTDFYSDAEVAFGLLCSIVRLVSNQQTQVVISLQLDEYRYARGAFKEGSAVGNRNIVSPVKWWSMYGKDYPELQRFAIRILSQTCEGAFRYGLKRDLAEKLLLHGRSPIEQRQLSDFAFVHYNLQLRNKQFIIESDLAIEDIDPINDWMIDEALEITPRNGDLEWMDSDCTNFAISEEGTCTIQAKDEPR